MKREEILKEEVKSFLQEITMKGFSMREIEDMLKEVVEKEVSKPYNKNWASEK
jgi:DNA-binding transcriptional regulator YhcF (GntR family)